MSLVSDAGYIVLAQGPRLLVIWSAIQIANVIDLPKPRGGFELD